MPINNSDLISVEELDAFLEVWPLYVAQNFEIPDPVQISNFSDQPSEALPWHIRFWLFKHCWEANRFYYVDQRLRLILKTSHLKTHNRDVIAILERLMQEDGAGAKGEAYQEMIKTQEKLSTIEHISDEELELVKGREDAIEDILNETNSPDVF